MTRDDLLDALRRPPPALRPVLVGAVVGGICLLVGMDLVSALSIGAVGAVVVLGWWMTTGRKRHPWPEARLEQTDGTRREISALTSAFFGRDRRVSEAAVRRLRAIAERRLARHGAPIPGGFAAVARGEVAPDDVAAARALLDERSWRTLAGRGGWMPSLADLTHSIARLEQLGPDRSIDERQRT